MDKLLVYTTAIGFPYELPPVRSFTGVTWICLTDQEIKDARGWNIVKIISALPEDPYRTSRIFKTSPHRFFGEYSVSLYIDTTVTIKGNPRDFFNLLIPKEEHVFGAFHHSFRETLADEFVEVIKHKLDLESTVKEYHRVYQKHHPDLLKRQPTWGGVLARRHMDKRCIISMELWKTQILRYSRRDQLSLPWALLAIPKDKVNILNQTIFDSQFHRWPTGSKSKPDYQVVNPPLASLQKGRPHTKFQYDVTKQLWFAEDQSSRMKMFVSHEKRLDLYRAGIEHRLSWLLRDYRIPPDLINEGDLVIDVGANIGELGVHVNRRGGEYWAYEPDPAAFSALLENVHGSLFQVALSDKQETGVFYLDPANGDSSLFKPAKCDETITLQTVTLDSHLASMSCNRRIRLLKVEAEGMEPEVLRGARKTLRNVDFLAIDSGPERGGNSTLPSVMQVLEKHTFELIDCYLLRGTFMFRNRKAVNGNSL